VGGSWSTQREPTSLCGEHADSTQKGPRWGSKLMLLGFLFTSKRDNNLRLKMYHQEVEIAK